MNAFSRTGAAKEVAYRKNNAWEALRLLLIVCSVAMIFHVFWDAALEEVIDYEGSFWRSLMFSTAYAVSSMIFKFTPVYLK